MMNRANEIAKVIENMMDGYEAVVNEVVKNNNVRMTGISVKPIGSAIAPTVYIDEMVENGMETVEIAREVIKIVKENEININTSDITEIFTNKDRLLSVVQPKLVGANQPDDVISYPFLDMKVVFYVEVNNIPGTGKATVTLRKQHTNVNPAELYKAAINNMGKPFIQSIAEMLFGMGMLIMPMDEPPMMVLTNADKMFGATQILKTETLAELAEQFDDDVIILPSSIHEVICVPLSEIDGNPMVGMVREINRDMVDPKEVLSDNVYVYNRETRNIEIRRED